MNDVQGDIIQVADDSQEIITKARVMLEKLLTSVRNHYVETGNKSSCSVSIEFGQNKDEELVIKIIPKLTLPLETTEFYGEISSKGELKLI